MTEVVLEGKVIRLKPSAVIAEGGEAVIYDLGRGKAFKLYKPPTHLDFEGNPEAQRAAARRIEQHQRKLPAFPKNLPASVIAPEAFGRDRQDRIIGYRMPLLENRNALLEFAQRGFRAGVSNERVRSIFLRLHDAVSGIHEAGVQIGDFNDLNVLVPSAGDEVSVIDADSMQFGGFRCSVFTARFVDPLLCDPNRNEPFLVKPYTPDADWFAFGTMLFQCILFVHPYGGVYKPKKKEAQVKHTARPLKGISVFHAEVGYPKPAVPYKTLPDDLLQHLEGMFERQRRGVFPRTLLEGMRWTTCANCGTEHARGVCPNCAAAPPIAVKETVRVRGTVTATRMFRTTGRILFATVQNGTVLWLVHENGEFRRENGTVVTSGAVDPRVRYRLQGSTTLFGKERTVVKFPAAGAPERIDVDVADQRSIFDANAVNVFWTSGDKLRRSEALGPEIVGDVLSGLTHVWVGPTFGFGFYRASELQVAFVFDAGSRGVNDGVKLPKLRGQIVDAHCAFTKDRCWFFSSSQEGGKIMNRCSVIHRNGSIEATCEAVSGDGSWLSSIRGGAATGNVLLMPGDDGVLQIKSENGGLVVAKMFPDTEPFVDASTRLFVGGDGLYAVLRNEVVKLVIR